MGCQQTRTYQVSSSVGNKFIVCLVHSVLLLLTEVPTLVFFFFFIYQDIHSSRANPKSLLPSSRQASPLLSLFLLDRLSNMCVDSNLFFAGTTNKHIVMFDKRLPESVSTWTNDAMVNTLYAPLSCYVMFCFPSILTSWSRYVYRNGEYILSGDSDGYLKLWHISQSNGPIDKIINEEGIYISSCVWHEILVVLILQPKRSIQQGTNLFRTCMHHLAREKEKANILQ